MSAIARTCSLFVVISLATLAIPVWCDAANLLSARNLSAKNPLDLTGQEIATAFKHLVKNDPSGAAHISDLRNLLDLDSAKVEYDPITLKTTIKILTKDRNNLNDHQKDELREAVKFVLESIWEEDVHRTDSQHKRLMEGITVKTGPHFIGPNPIEPNASISPSVVGNGTILRIKAILDKPALKDSIIEFEIGDGSNNRKFKISIPKGGTSGMVEENMQRPIQIVHGKVSSATPHSRVTITRVFGVATPAFGEDSFMIKNLATTAPGPPEQGTDSNTVHADSCPICAPVYSCPTCSRRIGRW